MTLMEFISQTMFCLFLVFALALLPGSSLGNSGVASACRVSYAIKLFHYIPITAYSM